MVSYEHSLGSLTGLTRLYSPSFGPTGSSCELEFYYYKDDSSSILFSVFLQESDGDLQRLWKTEINSDNNFWTRVHLGLHNNNQKLRVYFEASGIKDLGDDYRPLLAIDDISFKNCERYYNSTCISQDLFKCDNKVCIPNNRVIRTIYLNSYKLNYFKEFFKGL